MKNKGFPDFHNLRLFYLWYVGLSCFLFYFKEIKLTMKSTREEVEFGTVELLLMEVSGMEGRE
jgi:hypothetical protein